MKNYKGYSAKQYKDIINGYIVSCISSEDVELTTDLEKVNHCYNRFVDEKWHWEKKQRGANLQKSFADWLQGLAIAIDFENYRIIELAKEWGALPIDATEKQEDKLLENWFNFFAAKFLQLHAKLNKSN